MGWRVKEALNRGEFQDAPWGQGLEALWGPEGSCAWLEQFGAHRGEGRMESRVEGGMLRSVGSVLKRSH